MELNSGSLGGESERVGERGGGRERMRMEMALPLRFLREDSHPRIDENVKLDPSPYEDHCFVRLLCGLSRSNADKMLSHP